MSSRSILAASLGAVVLFIWGFVFWTILPWTMETIRPLPNPAAVVNGVADIPSGTYYYPDITHTGLPMEDSAAIHAWNELHRKGPIIELRIRQEGVDAMSPALFFWGFVHFFASTLIAVILLRTVTPLLAGYRGRVFFLTLFGLLIGVFAHLSGPIWFYYPWDRALVDALYTLIGWFLAALVISAVMTQSRTDIEG